LTGFDTARCTGAAPEEWGHTDMTRFAFTKTRLDALAAPETGRLYAYDSRVPGLTLCLTAAGAKTFYFCRRVNGPYQRIRIGPWPDLSVEQARAEAKKLTGLMAQGVNPQAAKRAARGELTFGDMFTDYLERYSKPYKRSWEQDQWQYDRYLKKPLAGRKVSAVTQAEVQKLHASIGRDCGPYSANRAVALVSTIFNRCARDVPNPARGIKRFKEQSRDRFLDAAELRAFFVALQSEPSDTWRDFFTVALLTGARRSNVLGMAWQDVDLNRGLWRIPASDAKGGAPLVVILAAPVVEILRRRHGENGKSPFVFPSVGKSGHLEEPKKAWHDLLKRAGLVDGDGKNTARLHDLRRTLGSWQAGAGASLSIIGRTLAHRNVATTATYARLDLDPVRQSVETATQAILAAGNGQAQVAPALPAAVDGGR
jgi:integrase